MVVGKCRTVEVLGGEAIGTLKGLLERDVRPHLEADVSTYARGRTRCWLDRDMPLWPGEAGAEGARGVEGADRDLDAAPAGEATDGARHPRRGRDRPA